MSIPETRARLVGALEALPQLQAYGYTPAPIVAGQAWVVLVRGAPLNYCAEQADWFAYVALPAGNPQATVDAADQMIQPVLDALKPLAKITAFEPWQWPVEPGQQPIPVLRFSLEA